MILLGTLKFSFPASVPWGWKGMPESEHDRLRALAKAIRTICETTRIRVQVTEQKYPFLKGKPKIKIKKPRQIHVNFNSSLTMPAVVHERMPHFIPKPVEKLAEVSIGEIKKSSVLDPESVHAGRRPIGAY